MEGLGDVGPSPVLLSEKFKVLIQSYMYIALCLPGISNHTDVSCVCVCRGGAGEKVGESG